MTSASGANVGQETYLSDEFPTLSAGDRISVNLTSATFNNAADTIALAVASTEIPTSRTNILVWGWRSTAMYVTNFDGAGVNAGAFPAIPASGRPDSVFIERTANGWTLGSIKAGIETRFYTNITGVGATSITATGSAIGLYSDMRTNTSTWTVSNLTLAAAPPPLPLPDPDVDHDGLADAWEILYFRESPAESNATILAKYIGTDDPDGDTFDNEAEEIAGTDPTDARDFPFYSLIPVSDGNPATDENGYAGSSINSVAFTQSNLSTVAGQQFIAYYRRHATNPSAPDNNTIIIGRRNQDELNWELFSTNLYSLDINDTHDVISFAIDGDGFLHMSWGMHANINNPNGVTLYAKSTTSVLGTNPIVMNSLNQAGLTGQENIVTYPKFVTLPDGDVLFLFRELGSGNGDWYLSRYDTATRKWSPVHASSGGVQQPFMKGTGDLPSNCFYPDRMTLGPDGVLHLAGVFRNDYTTLQSNHRYVYLRSSDQGVTWQRSNGSTIVLPAVERSGFAGLGASHVPEIIEDLPQGLSIMNESGMTTDSAGHPVVANWWADKALSGDHTRQYHIYFHNGTNWQKRTVSARAIDNPNDQYASTTGPSLSSSWMGRPVVLTDAEDRIIVLYNDNRFAGITVVFSEPLAQDPGRNHWTRMNLTNENLGEHEVTYDEGRWKQDGVLELFYQKLPGMGASYGSRNNSTPVSVLEWDVRAYFNSPSHVVIDTRMTPGQTKLSASTRLGFHYDLKTSTNLNFSGPSVTSLPGNGTWQDFGTWPMNETRRFWRMERTEEATDTL